MNRVIYFPKWLWPERFELTHAPELDQPFTVVLFDKVSGRHVGNGTSVTRAAKAALKKREHVCRWGDPSVYRFEEGALK